MGVLQDIFLNTNIYMRIFDVPEKQSDLKGLHRGHKSKRERKEEKRRKRDYCFENAFYFSKIVIHVHMLR